MDGMRKSSKSCFNAEDAKERKVIQFFVKGMIDLKALNCLTQGISVKTALTVFKGPAYCPRSRFPQRPSRPLRLMPILESIFNHHHGCSGRKGQNDESCQIGPQAELLHHPTANKGGDEDAGMEHHVQHGHWFAPV